MLGLHFVSPFFGKPDKLARWQRVHGLDVTAVDVGDAFAAMLAAGPAHGYGKHLNPCIACKILMLSHARERCCRPRRAVHLSGEVLGQRPMSQRRDALDVISRDSGTRDLLLRPLSAPLHEAHAHGGVRAGGSRAAAPARFYLRAGILAGSSHKRMV